MMWKNGKPDEHGVYYYRVSDLGYIISRARVLEYDDDSEKSIPVWRYTAYDRAGTQEVESLVKMARDHLESMGKELQPELKMAWDGRAILGVYVTIAAAEQACEDRHARVTEHGE